MRSRILGIIFIVGLFSCIKRGKIAHVAPLYLPQNQGGDTESGIDPYVPLTAAQLTSGKFDLTFGNSGVSAVNVNADSDDVTAMVTKTTGEILLGSNTLLVRFTSEGTVDTEFNKTGIVNIPSDEFGYLNSLALTSDGKIISAGILAVTVGTDGDSLMNSIISRRTADGVLDSTFGNGGKVVTHLGGGHDGVFDMVVDADDSILIVGSTDVKLASAASPSSEADSADGIWQTQVALLRVNKAGIADATFGSSKNGIVLVPTDSNEASLNAVVLQADSKIVACGYVQIASETEFNTSSGLLMRFNKDGTLDPSFAKSGIIKSTFGARDILSKLTVLPDKSILVAGKTFSGEKTSGILLAKFKEDGSPDESFGDKGSVLTISDSLSYFEVNRVIVKSDGQILLVGTKRDDVPVIFVAKYNAAGVLDTTFGSNGLATYSTSAISDAAVGAFLDSGNIMIGGSTTDTADFYSKPAIFKIIP